MVFQKTFFGRKERRQKVRVKISVIQFLDLKICTNTFQNQMDMLARDDMSTRNNAFSNRAQKADISVINEN